MVELIVMNLRRRMARTALTAAGISVGVAAVVALLALSAGLNQTAGQLIHLGRADLGLFQRDAADPTSSVLPLSLLPHLKAEPEIRDVAPIQLIVDAVPHAPGAVVLGVQPHGFVADLLVLTAGRPMSAGHIEVGAQLAKDLRLQPGSRLRLGGHMFVVAGVFNSGIDEQDTGVMMVLSDAQRLAGRAPDEATTFAVRLTSTTTAQRAVTELQHQFPDLIAISDPSEAVRSGANNELISKAVLLIVVLALIIGTLAVANTMLAAVLERRRELAVLTTIGWSARRLAALVLGEAVAVSVIGTAGGLMLGVAASKLLPGALGLGAFISPVLTVWGFGRAVLIGVVIGLAGAIYPTWRVTRLRSALALAGN